MNDAWARLSVTIIMAALEECPYVRHLALVRSSFRNVFVIIFFYHTYAWLGLPPVILVKKFFQVSIVLPHLYKIWLVS